MLAPAYADNEVIGPKRGCRFIGNGFWLRKMSSAEWAQSAGTESERSHLLWGGTGLVAGKFLGRGRDTLVFFRSKRRKLGTRSEGQPAIRTKRRKLFDLGFGHAVPIGYLGFVDVERME